MYNLKIGRHCYDSLEAAEILPIHLGEEGSSGSVRDGVRDLVRKILLY